MWKVKIFFPQWRFKREGEKKQQSKWGGRKEKGRNLSARGIEGKGLPRKMPSARAQPRGL